MTDQKLHIAIAFDNNYLSPVYALLTSIFTNNPGDNVNIHAIAVDVGVPQQEELQSYAQLFCSTITFYEIDSNFGADFILPHTLWWTTSIYYRLLFPAVLPENIKKFLYLDTDIIVLKSLDGLLAKELNGKPIAAVEDDFEHRPELSVLEASSYFNSGVLLIDRQAWLNQDIANRAIAFIKRNRNNLVNPDQDALNAVLVNNWERLDSRYNLMFKDIPPNLAKREYAEFVDNTVVLHYTTQHKPWSITGQNRLRYLYHHYLAKAPRKHRAYYTDFIWNRHRIRKMMEIRLSEYLNGYPILQSFILRNRE